MEKKTADQYNPYALFAKSLVEQHAIGFTIRNNEITFDQKVPEEVEEKFREYYVYKIKPVPAFHPMYGHFIVMTAEQNPIILWAEITITATAGGIETN